MGRDGRVRTTTDFGGGTKVPGPSRVMLNAEVEVTSEHVRIVMRRMLSFCTSFRWSLYLFLDLEEEDFPDLKLGEAMLGGKEGFTCESVEL